MPAYYAKTVRDFLADSTQGIIGALTQANTRAKFIQLEAAAITAWEEQVTIIRDTFMKLDEERLQTGDWGLLLEFPIPRRQRRVDLVLLARGLIVIVEFKTSKVDAAARRQVEDYALDLADFHEPSRLAPIIPIVVAPIILATNERVGSLEDRQVNSVIACAPSELAVVLKQVCGQYRSENKPELDLETWNYGDYHPVPSIIEAALSIFSGMEVREIAHAYADAHNLTETVDAVFEAVEAARRDPKKTICFVTGIPGSGKSLAGLRAVHDPRMKSRLGTNPTFLSGNGPLVRILREALTRDFATRKGKTRRDVRREVETLIQNVHVFARNYWEDKKGLAPFERIIIFDEAQRAWNAAKNLRKFGRLISEPEMMLQIMDRHSEWAVIVALIGGGQEIHDGEAGLAEWGAALEKFGHWRVIVSPEAIKGGSSLADSTLFADEIPINADVREERSLHLPVSTRSYRALAITEWSNALLRGEPRIAIRCLSGIEAFPVVVTRDLASAKRWLRESDLPPGSAGWIIRHSHSVRRFLRLA